MFAQQVRLSPSDLTVTNVNPVDWCQCDSVLRSDHLHRLGSYGKHELLIGDGSSWLRHVPRHNPSGHLG